MGDAWSNPEGLCFTNEVGQLIEQRGLLRKFDRALERAKVTKQEGQGFHAFRRSLSDALAEAGVDVKAGQAVMGHSRSAIMLDVYRKHRPALGDKDVERLVRSSSVVGQNSGSE
jgi:integrase